MTTQAYRIRDLERRLNNLLMVGSVAEVDAPAARCRVRAGEILTAWLPWMTPAASQDRTWWAPSVGEQVLLLSPSGETAQGIVLPAINQFAHPAPSGDPAIIGRWLPDGTRLEYNHDTSTLTIECVGDVVINAAGNVAVTAGGEVTVDAPSIRHNDGNPVVTTGHICHFTGNPHGDGSSTVTAGK